MKILFVVPYTPTLIRTRPYNLLRGLAKQGHQTTLVTLWENTQEQKQLQQFEKDGIQVIATHLSKPRAVWNMLQAAPTSKPIQANFCWQPSLWGQLQNHLSQNHYDVVHVEHLRGSRYALNLKATIPTVWDSVDCITHLFEQASQHSRNWLARSRTAFELGRTRRYEAWLMHQFSRVLVTSPIDKQALEKLGACEKIPSPIAKIEVISNGVDLDYFQPTSKPRQTDTLVISGKMSYHANVTAALHFAQTILPLIWRERPQTKLVIVGQAPPPNIQALTADHRIIVTGFVPDLRPYLTEATAAVCPVVYGAGIQNKVLEAMACATPVVSGSTGVGALQARSESDYLLAEDPEGFANQVLRILNDANLARHIGLAGRAFVERHHAWPVMVKRLERTYQEASEIWKSQSLS